MIRVLPKKNNFHLKLPTEKGERSSTINLLRQPGKLEVEAEVLGMSQPIHFMIYLIDENDGERVSEFNSEINASKISFSLENNIYKAIRVSIPFDENASIELLVKVKYI